MIPMSNAYKQSMNDAFRNHSYMLVTIGAINQAAQHDAKFSDDSSYCYLSDKEKPFTEYEVENVYGTFEKNWMMADGVMYFPPRQNNESEYLLNNGFISENFCGAVRIEFGQEYDIRGLTIEFSKNYPVDFIITNGHKSISIVDNSESYWTTEEIFNGSTYIDIIPNRMRFVENRLRINKIHMGVGIIFDGSKIINASHSEFVSSISEELPTVDFSLTVENYNRLFDVENVDSAINYLEVGQEVTVKYGYELDNGSIVWIDGCVTRLYDWSADDKQMSLSARDKLSDLESTYYKGQYSEEGVSLYDLANSVCEDAGLEPYEYQIDEYLRRVIVHNPLPPVSHKECLQIIANAGRCKLRVDKSGIIAIEAAFATIISPKRMQVESDNAYVASDLKSLVNSAVKYEYATYSENQVTAEGTQYFLPRDGKYLSCGYISNDVSDANGDFENSPSVTVKLESATTYYSLYLNFLNNPPTEVAISTYLSGEEVGTYIVSNIQLSNYIEHDFGVFDEIRFVVNKGMPNSRVFMESIHFGDISDYYMNYDVLTSYPKGTQTEKIKAVDVYRTIFVLSNEVTDALTEKNKYPESGEYTIFTNEPYEITRATIDGSEMTIVERGNYYCVVSVPQAGEHEVKLYGKKYEQFTQTYRNNINTAGVIREWTNPLVSDENHLGMIAEWVGNDMLNNVDYDFTYRGEPRLEAGDIVYLENKYADHLQIKIYNHTLNFNGAISGTISARRAVSFIGE